MTETRLISQSSRELLFQDNRWWDWIYIPAGMAFLIVSFFSNSSDSNLSMLPTFGFSMVLMVIGITLISFRDQLSLDLETRTFLRQGAARWTTRVVHGSFDEIEGVVLSHQPPRRRRLLKLFAQPETWRIELAFPAPARPVLIEKTVDEAAAYASLVHFARLLRRPAFDGTAGGEQRRPYANSEPLPEPLPEPALEEDAAGPDPITSREPVIASATINLASAVGSPPASSGIELPADPGRETILLPSLLPRWFLIVSGALSLTFVGLAVATVRSAIDSGAFSLGALVPGLVCVVVALLAWIPSMRMACSRLRIDRMGSFLRFSTARHGRRYRVRMLHCREIETIDLRPSIVGYRSRKRQLFIRSARGIIRVGHNLDRRSVEWLLDAMRVMAGFDSRQDHGGPVSSPRSE